MVAGIKIDKAQFKSLRTYEDVRVTELDFRDIKLLPLEIKFYGLVRDINFKEGLFVIPEYDTDLKALDFNALCLVHDSVFKFPSSYLY